MERSRGQLQTKLWLSITRARSATAFCGPPRIVKLIGHAESPNAAHGGHALIPGREPATLAPKAFAAVIVGAPRIRIVRQSIGGVLRQHRYDNSESCHKLGSKAHLSLLVIMGITPLGHDPFMWPRTRGVAIHMTDSSPGPSTSSQVMGEISTAVAHRRADGRLVDERQRRDGKLTALTGADGVERDVHVLASTLPVALRRR